jgi:ribosomal protein S18 acetylase RimI-like enzyme
MRASDITPAANPYLRFERLPAPTRAELLEADIAAATRAAVVSRQAAGSWFALRHLAWDTDLLGLAVGRVDAATASNASPRELDEQATALDAALTAEGLRLATARVPQADTGASALLKQAGFARTGGLVNLALDGAPHPRRGAVEVRPAVPTDESLVRALATNGYVGRLSREPGLEPARVRRLYGEWAANDLRGRMSHVWVAVLDGHRVGFLAGRLDVVVDLRVGFVDLVVVDTHFRGRGAGYALIAACAYDLRAAGAGRIELNVDADNPAALTLYRSAGFEERFRYCDWSWWRE